MREIGAMTAVPGGMDLLSLDLLTLTAGVDKHNAFVREQVCRDLPYLGVKLDTAANAIDAPVISAANCCVWVAAEPANQGGGARQSGMDRGTLCAGSALCRNRSTSTEIPVEIGLAGLHSKSRHPTRQSSTPGSTASRTLQPRRRSIGTKEGILP